MGRKARITATVLLYQLAYFCIGLAEKQKRVEEPIQAKEGWAIRRTNAHRKNILHDCSMLSAYVVHPQFFDRTISHMDSKILCTVMCLQQPQCDGVFYQTDIKACNHYAADSMFFQETSQEGSKVIHCTKALRMVIKSTPPPYDEQAAAGRCSKLRARLATIDELFTLVSYGFGTCLCGWTTSGTWSIQNSHCAYSSQVAQCNVDEPTVYCTLNDV